jgi:hypothetical protein
MGQALLAVRKADDRGEDVVLALLKATKDEQLMQHICFAFANSATQKSVPTLQAIRAQAQASKNGGLTVAADHALKKIAERGK